MAKYRSHANFSFEEDKYFKGEVYTTFPEKYAQFFELLPEERVEKKVGKVSVETAARKPKHRKRG